MFRRPLVLAATAATAAALVVIPALPASAATDPITVTVTESDGTTPVASVPVSFVNAAGSLIGAKTTTATNGVATLSVPVTSSTRGWIEVGTETTGDSPKTFVVGGVRRVVQYVGTNPAAGGSTAYREASDALDASDLDALGSVHVALDRPGTIHIADTALKAADWTLENRGGDWVQEDTATGTTGVLDFTGVVPGAYTLDYVPANTGLLEGTIDVDVTAGQQTDASATPVTGAVLTGTVTVGGVRKKGVPVVAVSADGLVGGGFGSAVTNANGGFTIRGLDVGGYVVAYGADARLSDSLVSTVVGRTGAASTRAVDLATRVTTTASAVTYIGTSKTVTITDIANPPTADADLAVAGTVTGRVTLKKGTKATVSVEDEDGDLLDDEVVTSTGASASYTLGSIPSGPVRVIARVGAKWGSVTATAKRGARVVAKQITATHGLLTLTGTTAKSAGLAMVSGDGTVGIRQATISAAGRFVVHDLIPGRFRVGVVTTGYDYASHHIRIAASATRGIAAGAEYGTITGTVDSPLGGPLADAEVDLVGGTGVSGWASGETTSTGAFRATAAHGDYAWDAITGDDSGVGPMYLTPVSDATISVTSGGTTALGPVPTQALFH